jgi:hypothetical protein
MFHYAEKHSLQALKCVEKIFYIDWITFQTLLNANLTY